MFTEKDLQEAFYAGRQRQFDLDHVGMNDEEFPKFEEWLRRYRQSKNLGVLPVVSGSFPTDEEIEKWAFKKYHELEKAAWFDPLIEGAKWMRSKIRIQ